MKKDMFKGITVASCLISIICLYQVSSLKNEVRNMNNFLSSQISNVNSSVHNISSNVSNIISREASILISYNYNYLGVNMDNGTVQVHIDIVPKEHKKTTTAKIFIDNVEHDMNFVNGSFVLDADIPLLDVTHIDKVEIVDGDNIKSELLDWYIEPKYNYIMQVEVIPSLKFSSKNGYNLQGTIDINVNSNGDRAIDIKDILLVEVLEDKVINKENLKQINYNIEEENYKSFTVDINKTYDFPEKKMHKLYIAICDGNDFIYTTQIDKCYKYENGNYSRADIGNTPTEIYNKNEEKLCNNEQ